MKYFLTFEQRHTEWEMEAEPSFENLQERVREFCGAQSVHIRYQDDEGDLVTISSTEELLEGVHVSKELGFSSYFRLVVNAEPFPVQPALSWTSSDSFVVINNSNTATEEDSVLSGRNEFFHDIPKLEDLIVDATKNDLPSNPPPLVEISVPNTVTNESSVELSFGGAFDDDEELFNDEPPSLLSFDDLPELLMSSSFPPPPLREALDGDDDDVDDADDDLPALVTSNPFSFDVQKSAIDIPSRNPSVEQKTEHKNVDDSNNLSLPRLISPRSSSLEDNIVLDERTTLDDDILAQRKILKSSFKKLSKMAKKQRKLDYKLKRKQQKRHKKGFPVRDRVSVQTETDAVEDNLNELPSKAKLIELWVSFMSDQSVQAELPNATQVAFIKLTENPKDIHSALESVFNSCEAIANHPLIIRVRRHLSRLVPRLNGWIPQLLELGAQTCVLIIPHILNALPRLFDGGRDLDIDLQQLAKAFNVLPERIPEKVIHNRVICDICGMSPIVGARFKCAECDDYDLCDLCEAIEDYDFSRTVHESDHTLFKMKIARMANRQYGRYNPFHPPQHPHWAQRRGWWRGGDITGSGASSRSSSVSSSSDYQKSVSEGLQTAWRQMSSSNRFGGCKRSRSVGRPSADFVRDVTIMDRSVCLGKQTMIKTWTMVNSGSIPFPQGTKLVYTQGNLLHDKNMEFPVSPCLPGNRIDVSVVITTPEFPGRFVSYYRLKEPGISGQLFGQKVWVDFIVEAVVEEIPMKASPVEVTQPELTTTGIVSDSDTDDELPDLIDSLQSSPLNDVVDEPQIESVTHLLRDLMTPNQDKSAEVEIIDKVHDDEEVKTFDVPSVDSAPEAAAVEIQSEEVLESDSEVENAMKSLASMGFKNQKLNRFMLQKYDNDVQRVVDWLLTKI